MSPQLHRIFYGFHPSNFDQTVRGDGWRPTVFMYHGLMVAMWMGSALLLAFTWWYFGGVRRVRGWALWPVVAALAVTFVLLKSTGAFVLVVLAIVVMWLSKTLKTIWPMMVFPIGIVLYLILRATSLWSGGGVVEMAELFSHDRAQSLQFRLDNEDLLSAKARQQPWFGWGGWGRNRVYDEQTGKDLTVTDGLWIIEFGEHGLVGLVGLYGMMLIGPTLLAWRSRPDLWKTNPNYALAAGVAMMCLMEAADTLPNAMPIPVITMAMGACASIAMTINQETPVGVAAVTSPRRVRPAMPAVRAGAR